MTEETKEQEASTVLGGQNERLVINTSERIVSINTDTGLIDICHWRQGINRAENKPIAIIDMNYEFLEKKDSEELSKDDARILAAGLNAIIEDAENHGL